MPSWWLLFRAEPLSITRGWAEYPEEMFWNARAISNVDATRGME